MKSKGRFASNCPDLEAVVNYIANGGNKSSIWNIVNKLLTASTIYTFWNERNKRNFQDIRRNDIEVIAIIYKYIEDVLQNLNVKKSSAVFMAANMWNLRWEKGKLVPVQLLLAD